jgi:tellurium resistance protein TerD
MVDNAFAEICNAETGQVLFHYDLSEDYSTQTAVNTIEFSRSSSNPNEWVFRPIDEGYAEGLDGFMSMWGLQAERR